MEEKLEFERLMSMCREVHETLVQIVDKRTKEGAGMIEIILGLAGGIQSLLIAYSAWHNPKLNAEVVIKTATIYMLQGINEEEEYINEIIEGLENGTIKLSK